MAELFNNFKYQERKNAIKKMIDNSVNDETLVENILKFAYDMA